MSDNVPEPSSCRALVKWQPPETAQRPRPSSTPGDLLFYSLLAGAVSLFFAFAAGRRSLVGESLDIEPLMLLGASLVLGVLCLGWLAGAVDLDKEQKSDALQAKPERDSPKEASSKDGSSPEADSDSPPKPRPKARPVSQPNPTPRTRPAPARPKRSPLTRAQQEKNRRELSAILAGTLWIPALVPLFIAFDTTSPDDARQAREFLSQPPVFILYSVACVLFVVATSVSLRNLYHWLYGTPATPKGSVTNRDPRLCSLCPRVTPETFVARRRFGYEAVRICRQCDALVQHLFSSAPAVLHSFQSLQQLREHDFVRRTLHLVAQLDMGDELPAEVRKAAFEVLTANQKQKKNLRCPTCQKQRPRESIQTRAFPEPAAVCTACWQAYELLFPNDDEERHVRAYSVELLLRHQRWRTALPIIQRSAPRAELTTEDLDELVRLAHVVASRTS